MSEEQQAKVRQFANAENPVMYRDAQGLDLLMVYLSIAAPIKLKVVKHIMEANEYT